MLCSSMILELPGWVRIGLYCLGELSIDIGEIHDPVESKTVKLNLVFGDTHIIATTTNAIGTEIKKCEFKFESSY